MNIPAIAAAHTRKAVIDVGVSASPCNTGNLLLYLYFGFFIGRFGAAVNIAVASLFKVLGLYGFLKRP